MKSSDLKKQSTRNNGDVINYAAAGGWYVSFTKSSGEVSCRSPAGDFSILEDTAENANAAKRLFLEWANNLQRADQ